MNNAKNFIVWVNEEDHIRIISMQKGASLKQVWGRLVTAIHEMEKRIEFDAQLLLEMQRNELHFELEILHIWHEN